MQSLGLSSNWSGYPRCARDRCPDAGLQMSWTEEHCVPPQTQQEVGDISSTALFSTHCTEKRKEKALCKRNTEAKGTLRVRCQIHHDSETSGKNKSLQTQTK